MGSKTRLSSYCTKRANNGVNLVTSRKINTRLARPMRKQHVKCGLAADRLGCSILIKMASQPCGGAIANMPIHTVHVTKTYINLQQPQLFT